MKKKLNWGILSTAQIGVNALIPSVKNSAQGQCYAIASRTEKKAKEVAEIFCIPKVFSSYQNLVDCPEVDVVYNPLPTSKHFEWTLKAARAGKNILCEKPLAASADQARQMVEICKERKRLLLEGLL